MPDKHGRGTIDELAAIEVHVVDPALLDEGHPLEDQPLARFELALQLVEGLVQRCQAGEIPPDKTQHLALAKLPQHGREAGLILHPGQRSGQRSPHLIGAVGAVEQTAGVQPGQHGRIAQADLGKIIAMGTPTELKQSIGGDVVTLSPYETGAEECQEFIRRTQSALSDKPFVIRTQATDGELAVYVNKGESAAPKIMRLLASEGIEVESLSVSRPSLDDVFLKVTGRTIRSQEGTATTYAQMKRRRDRR